MRVVRASIVSVTAFLLVVATAASVSAAPQQSENAGKVEQTGSSVVKYNGPQIQAVVGYLFANDNLGSQWMLLDFAATGNKGDSVEINRKNIFIETPKGEKVPLATQEQFGNAYGDLQSSIARANIAGEPLDYWGGRRPCMLDFFSSGEHVVKLADWVNDRRVCYGRLYFEVPGSVQPGKYVLGIDLKEGNVRIPFTLR